MIKPISLNDHRMIFLESLIDTVPDLIFYKDINGVYLECNKKFAEFKGLKKEDIIGKNDYELYDNATAESYIDGDKKIIDTGDPVIYEVWVDYPDGRHSFLHTIKTPRYDNDGNLVGILGISRDITEMKEIEQRLTEREKFLSTILQTAQDGYIALALDGSIMEVNEAFCHMTSYSKKELLKMNISQIDSKLGMEQIIKNTKTILEAGSLVFETVHRRKDGTEFSVEVSSTKLNTGMDMIICFSRDITERKRELKEKEYLSYQDHLTGLFNRRYLDKELKRLDKENYLPLSVIAIDVNDLKLINDAFGHQSGDELLKAVAGTLSRSCRDEDILGRTGGDEFAIYLPKTDRKAAEIVKNRILNEAARTRIDPLILSLSVGYSTKTDMSIDINEIAKEADNMMYADKLQFAKIRKQAVLKEFYTTINEKNPYEKDHAEKVANYSTALAAAIGTNEDKLKSLNDAALMHDIGKIIIPGEILCKPEKLTEEDYEIIKQHSVIGYRILKGLEGYSQHAKAMLYHHERWDGTGYPMGLRGERIPVFSRVLAIADSYESMTGGRPYKGKMTTEEAIIELRNNAGTQFDPEMVEVFIKKVLSAK